VSAATLEFWLSPPALAALGLVVGSFLNVVIHRLPRMLERQWWSDVSAQMADADAHQAAFGRPPHPVLGEAAAQLRQGVDGLPALGLARPRSHCPACGHRLAWHENLPLLGWLRLRGRCAACGVRIPARYPLVETLTAALFAALGLRFGAVPEVLAWCGFAAALVALAAIDWDTTLLPDDLTLPLLWAGLAAAALGWTVGPGAAIAGAATGYLVLWTVHAVFKLVAGKEGMGHGDFKLLAALGAWLGAQALLPVLLLASVIGAAVGLAMKAGGTLREGRYVPFGPFLAGGGLAVLLAGPQNVTRWMGW
jgi:leader peptidase (prepilin peptidase)/N-methyltransferase